jgi:hypothetical protein
MRRIFVVAGVAAAAMVGSAVAVVGLGARASAGPKAAEVCAARWRVVARGPKVPFVKGIAAVSPSDVWAVGSSADWAGKPLIAHWDGNSLRVIQAFLPRSSREGGDLSAVAAVGADDVWAVGTDGNRHPHPIVMHWDGKLWRRVVVPRLAPDGSLSDVMALSEHDVWAVGWPDIIHWNGRAWRIYRVPMRHPPGGVQAIDGTSPTDIWAVGRQYDYAPNLDAQEPLALHWDGSIWRQTNALGTHYDAQGLLLNGFTAVDAASRTQVWALGWADDGWDSILISDGRRARVAHVSEGYIGSRYFGLSDIAVRSHTDVWAVGQAARELNPDKGASDNDPTWPFVLHFNGRTWQIQHTPFDRLLGTDLTALSISTPDEIWAAGKHLIMRRSC